MGELRRELFALLAGVFAQARSRLAGRRGRPRIPGR
jgi:hypothetical protein